MKRSALHKIIFLNHTGNPVINQQLKVLRNMQEEHSRDIYSYTIGRMNMTRLIGSLRHQILMESATVQLFLVE